jgi:hypothetical protein
LSDYPRLRFVITTLGEKGSVWIEKAEAASCPELGDEGASTVEAFVDRSYDQWSRAESVAVTDTAPSVRQMRLEWPRPCAEAGTEPSEWFKVWYCPPQRLRPDEIVDTTGAGDAFTAATLFSLLSAELCAHHTTLPPLPFVESLTHGHAFHVCGRQEWCPSYTKWATANSIVLCCEQLPGDGRSSRHARNRGPTPAPLY